MIDIGPNLSNEQFKHDLDNVINAAIINGVEGLILTSTDWKTYHANLNIIKKYEHQILIKTTFGLHPHSAIHDDIIFKNIDSAISKAEVVAIGEFGLDYFRMISPKEKQIEVMNKFLSVAQSKPELGLFLHERGAFDDFYSLLKQSKHTNKSVVHCFTGNKEQVKAYLDLGCYIGITGWISDHRRNSDVKEALQYVPLDRLMIETDCPYLTPFNIPNKPKRNEPSFLKYVAKSVAEIKNLPIDSIIEQTTKNSLDFFLLQAYNKKITNKIT